MHFLIDISRTQMHNLAVLTSERLQNAWRACEVVKATPIDANSLPVEGADYV